MLLLACSQGSDQLKQQQAWESLFDSAWTTSDDQLRWTLRSRLASTAGKSPYGFYARAWILAKGGKLQKAIKTSDSLLMGFPGFVQGYYLRANLRAEARDTAGAIDDFDKAIARKADFFEAYVNRGSLHFSHHHPELALVDFRKARSLHPESASVLLNLGHSQWALGQADSACLAWSGSARNGNLVADSLVRKWCAPSPTKP